MPYRARLTRDGKRKPGTVLRPQPDEGPVLSANALYREFKQDSKVRLAATQARRWSSKGGGEH